MPLHIESLISLTDEELKSKQETCLNLKQSGNELFIKSRFNDAIDLYNQALLLDGDINYILYSNIANCYFHLDDLHSCIDYCNQSISLNNSYVKPLYRRIKANCILNSVDSLNQVVIDCRQLLVLEPGNQYALDLLDSVPLKLRLLREREQQELLEKCKVLGNSFLGKFGLSTDMFTSKENEDGSFVFQGEKRS